MKRTSAALSMTVIIAGLLTACSGSPAPSDAGSAANASATAAASPAAAVSATSTATASATTAASVGTAAASASAGASPTATSAATVATPRPPTVVAVAAVENGEKYAFNPAAITVAAGEVTVRFTNNGKREHTFILTNPAGGRDIADSGRVEAGSSTDVKFTVTAPGPYRFLCAVEGHEDRGQFGFLTVAG